MARLTFEDWIPEEWGGPVITKMAELSVVERVARVEPMATDTKHVIRSAGATYLGGIAKGASYTESTGTHDQVLLTAIKQGYVDRIADEDTKDTVGLVNVIQAKQLDWARSYAVGFDNATLGASAAGNGTTVPYTSLYKALRTTNSAVSYTADANRIATGGNLDYSDISSAVSMVEGSDYFAEGDTVVIAHPAFKAYLRNMVDSHGDPYWVEGRSQAAGTLDTLLGYPVYWTRGAKTSATATSAPAGNPLLFVGNARFLSKGDRSGPEYMVAPADSGAAFMTDEHLLKFRVRRGFAVANENAFSVIEKT